MKKSLRIAICAPNQHSGSETFIANHVAHLPGEIFFLYGGWFPFNFNGKPLTASVKSWPLQGFIQKILGNKTVPESRETLFKKFLVHFHGFDAYHHSTLEQYGEKYKTVLNKAAAVVAVSADMKKQLVKVGIEENKIELIHYGVDISLFSPPVNKQFTPSFIGVGRFVSKKAPHLTILAFAEVVKEFPDARLTLAGDAGLGNAPELLITCKQLVKALHITDRVSFPGSVQQQEIARLMKESGVFVQHSVVSDSGDSEGTPNTVIEASASGLCVIATSHGGIPDVVVHEETGYLCDEFDVKTMAAMMKKALQDPARTLSMGEAGAQRIRSNFDLSQQLNKLYEVLERAV
ncbi:MAG: glycosyltransferase family 4 protein [Bacteroidetes bacterium]|nr:glycosyltransferase family 4 protein [Bacteroidota bacterium]